MKMVAKTSMFLLHNSSFAFVIHEYAYVCENGNAKYNNPSIQNTQNIRRITLLWTARWIILETIEVPSSLDAN